eukprot:GHVN01015747.1.p1 GENE.GHVN01015747.1~~GHVN01015747.1.p1  ORF type:complete len:1083 (-),score=185.52 GHVN01015747.1:1393-4620(-)
MDDLLYWWHLGGGDVRQVMRDDHVVAPLPPVLHIPLCEKLIHNTTNTDPQPTKQINSATRHQTIDEQWGANSKVEQLTQWESTPFVPVYSIDPLGIHRGSQVNRFGAENRQSSSGNVTTHQCVTGRVNSEGGAQFWESARQEAEKERYGREAAEVNELSPSDDVSGRQRWVVEGVRRRRNWSVDDVDGGCERVDAIDLERGLIKPQWREHDWTIVAIPMVRLLQCLELADQLDQRDQPSKERSGSKPCSSLPSQDEGKKSSSGSTSPTSSKHAINKSGKRRESPQASTKVIKQGGTRKLSPTHASPKCGGGSHVVTASNYVVVPDGRESHFFYQRHRVTLFRNWLSWLPRSRPQLIKGAVVDIPPLLRPQIWCAVLGVSDPHDTSTPCSGMATDESWTLEYREAVYLSTPKTPQQQLQIDFSKCHPAHPLVGSDEGKRCVRRLVQVLLFKHNQLEHMRGLECVAAPLVALFYGQETVAYECFERIVLNFLASYLAPSCTASALSSQMRLLDSFLMFLDPQLAIHLKRAGVLPASYALQWFTTLFASSIPIADIFVLWDALLVEPPEFTTILSGVLIHNMRSHLLALSDLQELLTSISLYLTRDARALNQLNTGTVTDEGGGDNGARVSPLASHSLVEVSRALVTQLPPSLNMPHNPSTDSVNATDSHPSPVIVPLVDDLSSSLCGSKQRTENGGQRGTVESEKKREDRRQVAEHFYIGDDEEDAGSPKIEGCENGRDLLTYFPSGTNHPGECAIMGMSVSDLVMNFHKCVILDVRTEEEFSMGCVQHSIHVPDHLVNNLSTSNDPTDNTNTIEASPNRYRELADFLIATHLRCVAPIPLDSPTPARASSFTTPQHQKQKLRGNWATSQSSSPPTPISQSSPPHYTFTDILTPLTTPKAGLHPTPRSILVTPDSCIHLELSDAQNTSRKTHNSTEPRSPSASDTATPADAHTFIGTRGGIMVRSITDDLTEPSRRSAGSGPPSPAKQHSTSRRSICSKLPWVQQRTVGPILTSSALVVIVGPRDSHLATSFSVELASAGICMVCTVSGGWEAVETHEEGRALVVSPLMNKGQSKRG